MIFDRFAEESVYNFKRMGSFGQFVSGSSFPIEYFVTTFACTDLAKLTFARDISMKPLNFELLMQREIDEQRVYSEMEPYLNPNNKPRSPGELYSKAVYFPPLLAAIVPVKGDVMASYYTGENDDRVTENINGQEQIRYSREWEGLFKLTYLPSQLPHAYRLSLEMDNQLTEVKVQSEPVQLEACLASGNQTGVKFVVIDGQHRLFTLQKVFERYPQWLANLRVPVCMLLAPQATVAKQAVATSVKVPTVPEVCRSLFVDINSTAQSVSGHLNVLLSDQTISSLACRQFCDYILTKWGKEGLAVIEWNTANREATRILRAYSLTSVTAIDSALAGCLGKRPKLWQYLLRLSEVTADFALTSDDSSLFNSDIQWHQFSLSHKTLLEQQVKIHLVPCLEQLLFKSQEFAKAFDCFERHLQALKQSADSEKSEALEAQLVLKQVLDYIPLQVSSSFDTARVIYRNFEQRIKQDKAAQVSPLIQYTLFQRALFEAWAQVLDIVRVEVHSPVRATTGFVHLLDLAFQPTGVFFSVERLYLKPNVFANNRILVRENTKKFFTHLLLAHLANPLSAQQVVKVMQLPKREVADKLAHQLQLLGKKAFLNGSASIEQAFKKQFAADYRAQALDMALQQELIQAEAEYKRHQRAVKKGKLLKEEVSKQFEWLVADYVKKEVEEALGLFKQHIYG